MIKQYTCISLCVLQAAACVALSSFPKRTHLSRIVEDRHTIFGELSYQVSIRLDGTHVCGGSLVEVRRKQVILTAAQCVVSGNASSSYSVMAGSLYRTVNNYQAQIRQVSSIRAHENYDERTYANDIAILFISEPFSTSNEYIVVSSIKLPSPLVPYDGDLIVSGWGSDDSGGELSDVLQFVEMHVVNDTTCQTVYPEETILDSMICTGRVGEDDDSGSCQGDAGGPLKATPGGYLVGIVSWGYDCDHSTYPSVNTEVSYFIDWLNDKVREME